MKLPGRRTRTILLIAGLVFILCPRVWAEPLRMFIVPPQGEVRAGKGTGFTLFIHNPGTDVLTTREFNRIKIKLTRLKRSLTLEAVIRDHPLEEPVRIPANAYAKYEYSFLLPQDMDGNITLALEGADAGKVWFRARPLPLEEYEGQIALDTRESIFQPFIRHLSSYEPTYFLLGADPGIENSKFQLSFKYRLFNSSDENRLFSWLDDFYLAYTQTSYWDLNSNSKPFDDTSYKPELFYLFPEIDLGLSRVKGFGMKIGARHESNGQGGSISRSTNTAYIEPIMALSLGNNIYMKFAPRVWTYIDNEETNPDLADYRGYAGLGLALGNPDSFVLDTRTRWAEKGPSFQADLSYPLTKILGDRFNFFLHLQYFNGYAERLIDYTEKEEIIRLGFSIIR